MKIVLGLGYGSKQKKDTARKDIHVVFQKFIEHHRGLRSRTTDIGAGVLEVRSTTRGTGIGGGGA